MLWEMFQWLPQTNFVDGFNSYDLILKHLLYIASFKLFFKIKKLIKHNNLFLKSEYFRKVQHIYK